MVVLQNTGISLKKNCCIFVEASVTSLYVYPRLHKVQEIMFVLNFYMCRITPNQPNLGGPNQQQFWLMT